MFKKFSIDMYMEIIKKKILEHVKFTDTNRWVLKMKQLPSELNR